jgi:cytochrome b561
MALKSTSDHYGTIAVSIHWLSAILILVLTGSGFRAASTVDPAAKAAILRVHVPIALGLLVLMLLQIVWWWGFDRKPHPVAGSPHAAQAVHVLFYVVVFGMVASGVGMTVLSGAAPMILGGETGYPPRLPRGIGARLLLTLLVLHAVAALYHHFVRRDGLLWRMWFGNSSAAPPKRTIVFWLMTDIID